MAMTRGGASERTFRLALAAMLAALGTVIMLLSGLVPVLTYCSPLLASVMLIPVLTECGRAAGWSVWAATCLLVFILDIDKEAAFFYLFIGCYPLLKPALDAIRPRALSIAAKLGYFSASVAAMYALICFVFKIEEIMQDFSALMWANILLLVSLVAVLMVFDRVYDRFTLIWLYRIRPHISPLNRRK